jgi:hypothetical protein
MERGYMNRMKRRLAVAGAGLLLALGGAFATATNASAASGDSGLVLAGTIIYNCPWDACNYYEVTNYDAWIPFNCWQDSQLYPYDRFFYIYTVGWVKANQVYYQPSLPRCNHY